MVSVTGVLLLTFCFLLAKEALGHFSEEFLGRAWRVELWHHHTTAGRELIRSEALEGEAKDEPGKSQLQF